MLVVLLGAIIVELALCRRLGVGKRTRLPLYFCALGLLILPAGSTVRYVSLLRHSLPVIVILSLGVSHLLGRVGPQRLSRLGQWMLTCSRPLAVPLV